MKEASPADVGGKAPAPTGIKNNAASDDDGCFKDAGHTPHLRNFSKVAAFSICIGIAFAIFFVDLLIPRGFTVAALYVIPVVLAQRTKSIPYTIATVVFCASLASVGMVLAPDIGVPPRVVLANYAIVLAILIGTAALGMLAARRSVQVEQISKLLTMCAWTKQVKVHDKWVPIEEFLKSDLGVTITHGISEESARRLATEAGFKIRDRSATQT